MDPRSRRSRDRLTSAVIEFAAVGRLDDVSVSELAREAGVTRDTFYRHASSVNDLLAVALSDRLETGFAEYTSLRPPADDLQTLLQQSETQLLRHIASLADVYRTALLGQNSAPVRRALTAFLQKNLEIALREYPGIAPLPAEDLDASTVGMIAAYAASGTVGSIEVWLAAGDLDDIEKARRTIAASAPHWWAVVSGHAV